MTNPTTTLHTADTTPAITRSVTDAHTPNQQEEATAAMTAESHFAAASPCASHAYLTAKGIQPYGIRQSGDNLLIPMRDLAGTLQGLQAITPDGHHKFFPHDIAKGCCHLIDGNPVALLICESYAVGASLHEATGYAVAVAFHADNLEAVALALKAEFPDVPIIIAADNDNQTPGQPSLTAANTAAQVVGCPVAVPDFGTNKESHHTNFNDLHQLSRLEAVKRCIDAVLPALTANPAAGAPAASTGQVQGTALRNAPVPDPACLYGLVGDIAHAGSQNTEANPYAVAASAIAYLGAALGRGPYFPVGDDLHHARLFLLHVGRSGLGRKGTAKKLVKRIHEALKAKDELLAPQVHSGGLSSREGLAMLIHDGYTDGRTSHPAVADKRLQVIESEFANVLHQTKRDGNTLSTALRDAWDGNNIQPAVKTSRVWATDPHISIIGDITPSELLDVMATRELTNGFANRFIFIYAEGDKINAFPQPTPVSVVEALADRVAEVLRYAGADNHGSNNVLRMTFSANAALAYEGLYGGELCDRSDGERIAALLDRRAPVLLRLAMLFALTDQTHIISVEHIDAAMAWVRYWVDSVKFIFQGPANPLATKAKPTIAQRIVDHLTAHVQATRTELMANCFGKHIVAAELDKALNELLATTPPTIQATTQPRTNGKGGTPATVYSLVPSAPATSSANTANCATSAPAAAVPV
jgi:hypothetical protein